MRTPLLALALTLMSLSALAQVREQGAHEHGAARLDIAWVDGVLELQLDGPAFNFLGFERAPGSLEEMAAVDAARAALADPTALYSLAAAAACVALAPNVTTPLPEAVAASAASDRPEAVADHDHDHAHAHEHDHDHDHDHAHDHADAAHSSWRAQQRFRCGQPDALDALELQLFARFPALQRIDYQLLTDTSQIGGRLERAEGGTRIGLRP
jgi:hypothetical protein